jgi:hypothetical protein
MFFVKSPHATAGLRDLVNYRTWFVKLMAVRLMLSAKTYNE